MKSKYLRPFTAILAVLGMANQALADNPNFTNGDLMLFFQDEGNQTLYVSLGNTATEFRGAATGPDAANKYDIINIAAIMESAFGVNWRTRTDLYMGLAGCWGNGLDAALQNGDPQRTLYVSASRGTTQPVGTVDSGGYTVVTNTGMTSAAGEIIGMGGPFDLNGVSATYAITKGSPDGGVTVGSQIDEKNPIIGPGVQDTAFGTFSLGVQAQGSNTLWATDFGDAEDIEFALDLFRIPARTNLAGQVGFGETIRVGTFEGTVVLESDGGVSFVVSAAPPLSAYEIWANDNALVGADRDADADPEGDGIVNGIEFIIDGDPNLAVDADKLPTIDVNPTNVEFSFRRTDVSAYLNPVVQHDTDLVAPWTNAVDGVDGVTILTDDDFHGVGIDRVRVTIPSTVPRNFFKLTVETP